MQCFTNYQSAELFTSRKELFDELEAGGLDFFLVVGESVSGMSAQDITLPSSPFSDFDVLCSSIGVA